MDSDSESETDSESIPSAQETLTSVARRVGTKQSPAIKMFHRHFPVTITLDTGAESSMIKHFFCKVH